MKKSVAFVVAHDSQLKWANLVGQEMSAHGWDTTYVAITDFSGFSESQCFDAGLTPEQVTSLSIQGAISFFYSVDAVIFLTAGGQTERMLYTLRTENSSHKRRPVTAAAYVGMVIDGHGGGLLYRAPADLIFVNSQYDYSIFKDVFSALDISTSGLILSGLAILPKAPPSTARQQIKQVVFADQVIIPKKKVERQLLYSHLLAYAQAHPDRRVIIKPRHRMNERSFQKGSYPPESYFSAVTRPPNLIIDYTPLSELLPQTDLLLTISSTAAIEALAHGVKVAIISDLGIKENFGNHMFLHSNLIRTFAQIADDDIGSPNPLWLAQYMDGSDNPAMEIRIALEKAVAQNHLHSSPVVSVPYFTARQQFCKIMGNQVSHSSAEGELKKRIISIGGALLPPLLAKPLHKVLCKLGIL